MTEPSFSSALPSGSLGVKTYLHTEISCFGHITEESDLYYTGKHFDPA